jgi:hypothetical protein
MNGKIKRLHLLVGAGAAAAVLAPAAMAASPVSLPDGLAYATPAAGSIAKSTPLLSEHSSPLNVRVADDRTAGQIADGLRYQALADAYQRAASTPTAQGLATRSGSSAGDGFDWGSAGIGAGFVAFFAAISALGVALRVGRRRVAQA